MERRIKIKIPGIKKCIYGVLRGSLSRPLVVFVHGLTGHMNEHIFYNGARFLESHGFSSFRFNLYSFEPDARKLDECTLQTHADDLDVVIAHLRKTGVRKIFVIGHSYGGPTILLSRRKDFDGVVLWDPSYAESGSLAKEAVYIRALDKYYLDWSCKKIVGKEMFAFSKQMNARRSKAWIASLHVPVKIIVAGKGEILARGGKGFYDAANRPKDFAIIKGADHNFNVDGTEEQLFKETLGWIKKSHKSLP